MDLWTTYSKIFFSSFVASEWEKPKRTFYIEKERASNWGKEGEGEERHNYGADNPFLGHNPSKDLSIIFWSRKLPLASLSPTVWRGFLILDFFCHVLWEETSTCVVSFLFIFPHRVLPVKEERHLIKILRSNIREKRRRRRQKNIQFSAVLCGGETRWRLDWSFLDGEW